ncbi:RNA polymerase sigma factor [Alkalitalea saponilacus]|uniref:RNA polymerase sigma-70 factor, ECF subfamily n=1 Tax=Alkalitalea saponilacus TaxID=889453 RepID=A0A1T5GRB1_9BACT|nr:sigma-70 family RNA polymerase sigma factor [Alkalitalea saponilacus]ASB48219.1 RNA polymerase subunit sigma-24 [Alkalitalea saponilacus]SKC10870.1 RNA polymerase sigma-70 factor, ECF subfamily [Alkalitalea saponilacus]
MKIKGKSDEELIRLYLSKKDNRWIEELLGRYIQFVLAVCMKYLKDEDLAKDISMQVFEKVLADLPRFEISNFKSWLYMVTKNSCMMHFREAKKHQLFSLSQEENSSAVVENQLFLHHNDEEQNNHESKLKALEKAMISLDEGQKQCVQMFYIEEFSYNEIVQKTGYTINQVKSYIQNGKRNLKNLILKQGGVELFLFFMIYYQL